MATSSLSSRSMREGLSRKKVSCISLAGWSWGMKRVSMFQKAVWTYSEDISLNPISVNILRTSLPSLVRGFFLAV